MRSTAWRLDRAAGARHAHPGVRISVSAGAEGPRARSRGSRPRGHARGMGRGAHVILGASAKGKELEALIFDCDGVILESEHLHREYVFTHFSCCTEIVTATDSMWCASVKGLQ